MTDQGDIVEISYVPDDPDEETTLHEEKIEHSESEDEQPKKSKKKTISSKKLQKKLKELDEQIETLTKERDEYKDKYLRNLAEMDNFRKRVKKEKEEFRKYVLGDFLLGLLEVMDNLERALNAKNKGKDGDAGTNDEKSIVSGVEMIYKQLMDLLKKNNVTEIDSLGKFFDPNIHQALSKVEQEGIAQPVVMEVYQKGFMYNNKLLRPTLAKVAIPMEKPAPPPEDQPKTQSQADADEEEKRTDLEA